MPNVKSAKKRNRQNIKRNAYNVQMKSKIKTFEKKINIELLDSKIEDAKNTLNFYFKAIDKAVVRNVLKKNTGARRKSLMAKKIYSPKKKDE